MDRKYQFQSLSEWHVCTPDIEIGWIKLNLKLTKPTYIGLIYRPPSGNYENCLEIIEQKLLDINSQGDANILLIGDININLLSRGDSMVNKYRKWIHQQRLKSMKSAIFDPGISDHNLIFASRKKKHLPRTHTYMSLADHIVILMKTSFDFFSIIRIGLRLHPVRMLI